MVAGYYPGPETEPLDMYDRIKNDEFKNTYPYPNRSYYKSNGWDDRLGEELAAHRAAENVAFMRFREAALFDVGLENHPNSLVIFYFAWEEGHSSGLLEVYNYLCQISELFFFKGQLLVRSQQHVDEAIVAGFDINDYKVWTGGE